MGSYLYQIHLYRISPHRRSFCVAAPPDISLAWGKVEITTWTHKINGLTESDFILAAKIDQLCKL